MSLTCVSISVGIVLGGLAVAGLASEVEFIAHRGESYDAPENTLAAFRLAWERGVTTIELDVHLTRDGELAVIHDADTLRTTGVAKVVAESTMDELRALDAGRWKSERYAGEKIPTLSEVLETIPENGRCFIEVKVGPEAVPALVRAVRASGKRPDQLVVITFHAKTLAEAKAQLPEITMYYLSGFVQDETTKRWTPTFESLIETARSIGADGLNLSARGPLDRDAVQAIRAANLGAFVWTVDDPDLARALVAQGFQGITTNRAAWLREKLAAE